VFNPGARISLFAPLFAFCANRCVRPIVVCPAMVASAAQEEDAMLEMIPMSHHAQVRSRQRGIPRDAIEVILNFGREEQSFKNRQVVFMDKEARRRAREVLGRTAYAQIEARLDAAVIIGNRGSVITCMHRKSRIYRAA